MTNHNDNKAVAISVKLYARLLALYPAGFRHEFASSMKQVFRDQCRDAWSESRRWGLAALWVRTVPDLFKTSFTQHLDNLRNQKPMRAAFLRTLAAVFVIGLVWSVLMSFWTTKLYYGTARFEVQDYDTTSFGAENSPVPDPYFVVTQLKIIESYSILTNVIAGLDLEHKLASQADEKVWTMDQTYAALFPNISVEETRMTDLFEISVKNPNPRLAADIANAIVDTYRASRLEKWGNDAHLGISMLKAKLSADKATLAGMEKDLSGLKNELHISNEDDLGPQPNGGAESDQQELTRKYRQYLILKGKIQELRRNNDDLKQTIQRETARLGPTPLLVIVRDPARQNLKPIHSGFEIFSIWLLGGAMIAVVAGGSVVLVQRLRCAPL